MKKTIFLLILCLFVFISNYKIYSFDIDYELSSNVLINDNIYKEGDIVRSGDIIKYELIIKNIGNNIINNIDTISTVNLKDKFGNVIDTKEEGKIIDTLLEYEDNIIELIYEVPNLNYVDNVISLNSISYTKTVNDAEIKRNILEPINISIKPNFNIVFVGIRSYKNKILGILIFTMGIILFWKVKTRHSSVNKIKIVD